MSSGLLTYWLGVLVLWIMLSSAQVTYFGSENETQNESNLISNRATEKCTLWCHNIVWLNWSFCSDLFICSWHSCEYAIEYYSVRIFTTIAFGYRLTDLLRIWVNYYTGTEWYHFFNFEFKYIFCLSILLIPVQVKSQATGTYLLSFQYLMLLLNVLHNDKFPWLLA